MANPAWVKGVSGNPSGRPKIDPSVKEMARAHTAAAIATLAKIMKNVEEPSAARVRSAEILLNRAWGTPESTVTVRDAKDVRDLSTEALLQAIDAERVISSEDGAGELPSVH